MPPNLQQPLPQFSQIKVEKIESELKKILKRHLATIDTLLAANTHYTWANFVQPIEDINDELHQFWSPIQHMNAVVDSPELREVINACLPLLSDYETTISHNAKYFHAIQRIKDSDEFESLTVAQQKTIENELRDFKLSGVNLPKKQKAEFAKLSKSLSQLTHEFEENVLDATMGWKKHITDESMLAGLPEHAIAAAKAAAKKDKCDGWVFTLEGPSYLSVMMYADSRELRESVYEAFATRASDCGPNAGKWDNTKVMQAILEKRFALAKLLGFDNYAQYSLATKMVKKTDEALAFLNELAKKSLKCAQNEFQTLSQFAAEKLNLSELKPWDIAYASEKLRQQEYNISQEDLRPYFPEPQVLAGLFKVIHKLYGVTVKKTDNVDVWHQDVKCFDLFNSKGGLQARLLLDLYARNNKRGGAWMDECSIRRQLTNGDIQVPAAYVTCNFNSPIGDDPALFSHDDVVTLFHECGHALQHVLTNIDVASVSGINGIPWDAVEVASQFFENWAWEKESVALFAKHFKNDNALPDNLFNRMHKAKHFQSAMQMVRQLEFSLFDFRLHMEYNPSDPNCIQKIIDEIRAQISVVPVADFNRFQHAFSHIFAGGYAAGYYSYKWAEVMACDAFSLFLENGIFDSTTSKRFKETFLESGGAKEPMDLFVDFRGRKPHVDALLEQSGIT